jgi:hypothetical protein
MALEEDLEKLRDATLRRLSLQPIETVGYTFEVVATILGPRDEPLEEPMRESLASHLAARIERAIREKNPEGHTPVGIASSKVDHSDEADCERAQGEKVNAFMAGERCYRIVVRISTAESQ